MSKEPADDEEPISPAERMYRMIRDRVILEELPPEQWQAALDAAMERADQEHIAGEALSDQLIKELSDTRAREEELRRRLEG